ncbi:MAG: HmuY family protein [Sediminibacterium sp.]|nr:HmuY family protein [Sediminibacterium sp.]MBP6144925.1 HmuY family protein [Sediminibacterium sp.]MBP7940214.1 HmuY family protein [Sediminibacterium sp.]
MKKMVSKIAMVLGVSVTMLACSKDDTAVVVPVSAITVRDLAADTVTGIGVDGRPQSAGSITYYSLVDNKVIAAADAATTKWDVAFTATKVLVNSGTSGPGLGGAFVFKGLFDDLKTIPSDSTFATDNSNASSFAIPWGSGKGWYTYDGLTTLVNPIAGRVLVIRTAAGKFAKIEIINYYKGGVTLPSTAADMDKLTKQRYYTFRYAYQPNGTTTF